ncbi:MAG: NADH:flavin oxidoreductase/NADH oxidase [Acidobacteria bacterium]|nr:NADH:flavin oxidoreductase/NADH oxidase [Bacteroidota bacterium]MBS1766486.1 NADH:flavin oxidoreductase/NADH oxidase [Acidobacteriota bacterium]
MARLFEPLTLRGITLPNRIGVSPMCQYSCEDGFASDWHLVHLGSRAVGGAGLVLTEAAAVTPEGRISPQDLGLWSDAHAEPLARIAAFIRSQQAVPGIQLAHAGRKASRSRPWEGDRWMEAAEGGWTRLGPSPLPYGPVPPPRAMDAADLAAVRDAFVAAAGRAVDAGFQVVELHAAHGYLLHEFMSPLSNHREDAYGGSPEARMRFPLEVAEAVRAAMPEALPLFVRVSATDWVEGGWTLEDTVAFAARLKALGADLVDCSSGGLDPGARITSGPNYQVPFAEAVRREAGIPTAAVGLITAPPQAEAILQAGQADLILLGREELRDPYWPLHAADALEHKAPWPAQYLRAAHRDTPAR